MKNHIACLIVFSFFFVCHSSYAQQGQTSAETKEPVLLFRSQKTLPIQLNFSTKEIRKKTNDSTYINSTLGYASEDSSLKELKVELRVRGDFRLTNCYFPPLKVQFKKSESKGTLFEGNKELKLTVQCSAKKGTNDYVIKEYMAYKLYELISDYHYKTRLADISFQEIKGSDAKNFEFKGFFIEDTKNVAERLGGNVMKRLVHPMAQDHLESVHNAFFMYMIGNTDFSTYVQHNEKLLYVDKKIVPLPYDFDMSGLVNASYATISEANEEPLPISSVRERLYRGFKRDPKIIAQVRQEFLDKKNDIMAVVDGLEPLFENPKEFSDTKDYMLQFYKVMENDALYHKEITSRLRTK
jgi:hypothetical protein